MAYALRDLGVPGPLSNPDKWVVRTPKDYPRHVVEENNVAAD